ncbi:MAG: hypothetical protein BWY32_00476 [bacterium ADurb.Bin243]|nr:MAG: hypothetical protein BWY32_00476 [bacterium ADurb.Bin243]
MKNKSGFTVVEIIVVTLIATSIMAAIYTFLIRSHKHHELETKNLEAIQEMAFIIYNLRSDLRTLIEFENDPDTFAVYDAAAKTLSLNIVNGVTENGIIIYSKVLYCFENGCLIKKFQVIESDGLSGLRTRKLTGANKLSEFEIKILDAAGNHLSNTRAPGQKPRYLKTKILHSTNARLDVMINIYSTYIENQLVDDMQKYWLPTWKISTINPAVTMIMTNFGNITVNLGSLPNSSSTANGIRIGSNMGTSTGLSQ